VQQPSNERKEKRMSTLKVPGAQLSYEVEGSGPLLILIPGAAGVGEVFHQVARELSARYHVVTYDRRGFSRSQLDQLLSLSLEVQTIYALLQAFL
jgi:acetyltransferase/esterase